MGANVTISLVGWSISNGLIIGLLGTYISFHPTDLKYIIWIGIAAGLISSVYPSRTKLEDRELAKLSDVLDRQNNRPMSYQNAALMSFFMMSAFAILEFFLLYGIINHTKLLILNDPFRSFFSFLLPYLITCQVIMGFKKIITS